MQSSYNEGTVYLQYQENGNYTIFADYSFTDVTITDATPDVDDDNDDDDTTTETDADDMNVFMLISSIAVSAALVVALGGIATQRIMKIVKKRKASKAPANVVKKNK